MARLPKDGEYNWGKVLNNFLKQTVDNSGNLLTESVNPHTGAENTNLANADRPGLVQLAGDLKSTAGAPKVAGLQGKPVAPTSPTHGQVLTWNASTGVWEPSAPAASALAQSMAINSMRI